MSLHSPIAAVSGAAIGKVTHEDYQNILIPEAEAMIAKGPVKLFYVDGYELEALWDDSAFGVKHWHDFKRVAVVAARAWLRAAVTVFKPFFPCEDRCGEGLDHQ